MDEKLLIRKVLKGDTSSFSYFVDTYQDMAVTIAYRICGNREDAEDIVQNSYVKAFHNLHTFRTDSKFSTWFYRIVYNTALSHIKSVRLNTESVGYEKIQNEDVEQDWNPLLELEEKDRRKLIDRVLSEMSRDESLILTLYYLEENSIKDISVITSYSEANVKVKLFRARKSFAALLSIEKSIEFC